MSYAKRYASYLFVPVLMFTLACDEEGDNFLDGSLIKNYNVSYDSVRVRLYEESFSVEYVMSSDVPALVITIDRKENLVLAAGKTYKLERDGSIAWRDEKYGEIPELDSGELTLNEYEEKKGATVSGSFHAKLTAPGESTQTLRGAFKAELDIPEDM